MEIHSHCFLPCFHSGLYFLKNKKPHLLNAKKAQQMRTVRFIQPKNQNLDITEDGQPFLK
ncbi:MAG: hypothetical protein IIX27_02750, partial [Ruminococcus sp.]|nr:hypothetical protein [Ruminococcus sp.]